MDRRDTYPPHKSLSFRSLCPHLHARKHLETNIPANKLTLYAHRNPTCIDDPIVCRIIYANVAHSSEMCRYYPSRFDCTTHIIISYRCFILPLIQIYLVRRTNFFCNARFFFFSFFLEINKLNDPMDNAAVKG